MSSFTGLLVFCVFFVCTGWVVDFNLCIPPTCSKNSSLVYAVVINLASRLDRWLDFRREWGDAPYLSIARFRALPHIMRRNSTGTIRVSGCALSHHAAVIRTFAANPTLPFMLVLEDDAVPMPGFEQAFTEILDYAVQHPDDWDIINLGASMVMRGDELAAFEYRSHRLLRSTVWAAAHALLVNRRAIPAYERMIQSVVQHDLRTHAGRSDWTLSHDKSLVTLLSVPAIVRQSAGLSDMMRERQDNTPLFDEADKFLLLARDGFELTGWRKGQLVLQWFGSGPTDNTVLLDPLN